MTALEHILDGLEAELALERELGVQLFDRIGKNVSITQYGKDFVAYARDVVSAVTRASAFATANGDLTGTVMIGLGYSF